MKALLVLVAIGMMAGALALGTAARRAMPVQVQAETHRLRMWVTGEGSPSVILDSFGVENLETWGRIQAGISPFARCVSFDHGGFWGSDPGPKPRDARQLARELHAALRSAGVEPPYLLVGYSLGGPYARVFAGLYPGEVVGLVLVDPTQEDFMDWLRRTFPELDRTPAEHRVAQDEMGCVEASLEQARRASFPKVPLTLITAARPYDALSTVLHGRLQAAHARWLSAIPWARHRVTVGSGREVILEEPGLVVAAVREMLGGVPVGEVSRR